MQSLLKNIGIFKQKFKEFWATYSYFKSTNGTFEIYFKSPFFFKGKKRCSVPYDSIEAIYAGNSEFSCLDIIIFLKNKKWLCLDKSMFKDDYFSVKNWEEMVNILSEKCFNFNRNNLIQAERTAEDFPILCWHRKTQVSDIQFFYTKDEIKVFWKETGEEYLPNDFYSMMKESKRVKY